MRCYWARPSMAMRAGYFLEPYNSARFSEVTGLSPRFVQDNESMSHAGGVEGCTSTMPHTQAKLVRVWSGIGAGRLRGCTRRQPDVRQAFQGPIGRCEKRMLYVPEGFAHGFHPGGHTIFQYKCTAFYDRPSGGRSSGTTRHWASTGRSGTRCSVRRTARAFRCPGSVGTLDPSCTPASSSS